MQPTAAQLEILQAQDDQTLAAWSCELNCWGWPEALPDPEAAEYIPDGLRRAVMDWIDAKIGHRAVLRYHNRDMPDEIFESFWRGDREPSTLYGQWLKGKVEVIMTQLREREDAVIGSEFILEDILDAEEIG